ncbi:MAG: LamG domain-containing protein [Candidatus Paceibacterota bacterium]|jgi:hypothetical protein
MRLKLAIFLPLVFMALPAHAAFVISPTLGNITSGLVGWWTFDSRDITSGTVTNRGSLGGTGTRVGGTAGVGKIAQALSFDGSTGYVDVGNSGSYDAGANWTVSSWFTNTQSSSEERYIATKYNGQQAWFIGTKIDGFAGIGCEVRSGSPETFTYAIDSSSEYRDSKWHFVACTKSGTTVKIYIDGILKNSSTNASLGSSNTGTREAVIGGVDTGSPSASWLGKIDDTRIYNRALSESEVYTLYRYGSAKIVINSVAAMGQTASAKITTNSSQISQPNNLKTGLIGYWTFDGKDMTATAALDKSGNNNTAIATGSLLPIAGKIGQAMKLDGSTNCFTVTQTASLNSFSSQTISAWIKPTSVIASKNFVYKVHTDGNVMYVLWRNGSSWKYSVAPVDTQYDAVATGKAILNKWSHVVGVYDGSNIYIYIDGIAIGSPVAVTGTVDTGTAKNLAIGGNSAVAACPASSSANGIIDDVRIYNRALSANEIYQLYRLGK